MVPDHRAKLDYPVQSVIATEPDPEPLPERIERLERCLRELSDQVENHVISLAHVGSRLVRCEKHVGLPSTDV